MKVTPIIFGVFLFAGVSRSAAFPDKKHANNHRVVVEEVIQTTNYTYLHVNENDTLKWLAVPLMQARKGETYYYADAMPMAQFESKELHRTFDMVWFLGGVSQEPIGTEQPKQTGGSPHGANGAAYTRKAAPEVKENIKIDAPGDCITISELFAHKENYAGKTVKVKGQVTKYNADIMNKNWVHLQDGTEKNGKFDLEITTLSAAKVGDIKTFEGKITLNKDFGYGYAFEVMMEEASVK